MAIHSFDPEIAKQVGINAAVIYQNILFWAEKNRANERHIKDGYVWTYNSRRAFSELFPYLTDNQIRTAIKKLIDAKLIIKGDQNSNSYDRTCWYAPDVSAEWVSAIGEKSPMERGKITNGSGLDHQPIPDSKPDSKPDRKARASRAASVLGILSEVMSHETASDFVAHRNALRKPLTEKAAELIAQKLRGRSDADEIVKTSIMNGWLGVFPENKKSGKSNSAHVNVSSDADRRMARLKYIAEHGSSKGFH